LPKKIDNKSDFVLQQSLEMMKEFRISIHLPFIDFKSVYDSNDRQRMYEAMNELNIPENLAG